MQRSKRKAPGRRGRPPGCRRQPTTSLTFETLEKRFVLDGLVADIFPLNPFEPKLDGQWEGSVVASDGNVYFASSTHAHDTAGLFFQYKPGSGELTQIGSNLSAIVGEDPQTQVPQGKLHSPIVEADGWLYFATHLANYWNEAQDTYTGSHLVGYQLGSLENNNPVFDDFGIHRTRFTTYSAVGIDPAGENIWWVATPFASADVPQGTHLYRTNLASRSTVDLGSLDGSASGHVFTMHVDNRGDAWVTMEGGSDKLFVGRAADNTIDSFDHALPTMRDAFDPGKDSAHQDGSRWHGHSIDGERFLFSMRDSTAPASESAGGSLWEFDASKTLDNDLSDAFREVAWIGGNSITAYSDGIVYFARRSDGQHRETIDAVVNGGQNWDPAADNGVRLHLHSINLNVPGSGVTDWGMITDADDRVPWRLPSIAADAASGEVYLVGDWVLNETDPVEWRTQRHNTGPNTTYTEHMRMQALAVATTSSAVTTAPRVEVTATDAIAAEPNNNGELTFTRTGELTQPLTVHFTVSGTATPGDDFTPLGTTATIPAGTTKVSVPLVVIDDSDAETAETVLITLAADGAYDLGALSSASLIIASEDPPPPDPTLVGYWKLDETSGTIAADATDHGFDGTLVGDPLWTTGVAGGALEFDGSGDYVDLGIEPAIVGTGGFTVAAWVRTSQSKGQVIIQQRSPQQFNGEFILELQSSGHVYFWTFGDFATGPTIASTQTINDGQWHHVTGVREDDGTMRIYIDGELDGSAAGPSRTLVPIKVYLGADARNGNKYLEGGLDDVRIYDRALDAQDAQSLANTGVPVNATDDSYSINEDESLNVSPPGLLLNDFGFSPFVTSIDATSGLGISVTGGADGSFQYDPANAFDQLSASESASDTFTYTISDGINSDTGTVFITVSGVNDPPGVLADTASTNEDAAINIDVLANDDDVDQLDTLSITSFDETSTTGNVAFGPAGTISYDPRGLFDALAQDVTTTDSFTYTASDGNGGSSVGTVVVTVTGVNDDPTAVDDNVSTDENTAITVDVLQSDTDVDSAVLNVTGIDDLATIGSVTRVDNTVTYSPNGQFNDLVVGETATDTFQYTISDDQGAMSTGLVTVTINGLGVGFAAFDDNASTDEESVKLIDVLANDTDGGPPAVLSIANLDVTGTVGLVTHNTADDTFTYDPNGKFESLAVEETASDTFVYTASNGLSDTDDATVTVTIDGVNDAPIAVLDTSTTDEDTAVVISVLANDTDADTTDTLNVTGIDTSGLLGSAVANADGTITYDPSGVFDFLDIGDSAEESLTYTISDGKGGGDIGTITVTIEGRNEPPIAVPDDASTDEDSVVAINVLDNDSDVDSVSFSLTGVDISSVLGTVTFVAGGTITYDPAGQFEQLPVGGSATETIPYTITDSDGMSASSVLTVVISGLNDDPIAADDQYSVVGNQALSIPAPGILANDFDADVPATTGGFFFAATDGSASGDGGFDEPWDLETLFAHPAALQPGDTVYLRGGTYYGAPDAYITGTEADPITVRAYPGEHVRFDLYSPATYGDDRHIRFYGANVHWMNLEFMSSDPHSRITDIPNQGSPDINRGGLTVWADYNKFINVVSHDLNQGFGFWADGAGGEIYGSIIFNNGWIGPDRQHGHGIYTQNELGTKRIADTVIFNQFGMGLHAFGSSAAFFKGFEIEGNVLFNNGAGSGQGFLRERDLLVGGGTAAEDILVTENYTYSNGEDGVIAFGLLGGPDQENIEIVDNYFVGRVGFHSDWNDITFRGNTTYHIDDPIIDLGVPAGVQTSDYDWDENEYFNTLPNSFLFENTPHDWTQWRSITGLDANSTFAAAAPTGVEVFVRPNEYEAGRGNVVVYNWDLDSFVDVDLSQVLQPGDAYEIHNIVDLYGSPVLTGTYDGSPIALPMAEAVPPSPIGYVAAAPVGTGPQFGTFLVTTPTNAVGSLGLAVTSHDSLSALGVSISVNELGGFEYDATSLPIVQSLGPNDQLEDTFTYTVSDAHGGFDTATVTITISGVNNPPTAQNDDRSTSEDVEISIDVLSNDVDVDQGDQLRVQSVDISSTVGTVTLNPDNSVSYDPRGVLNHLTAGETFVDAFTYTAADDFDGTETAVVRVTVTGLNDAPTALDDSVSTDEDTSITIHVMGNDSDPDSSMNLLNVQRVAAGLTNPVFATAAPGQPDRLFIAEQNGQIKILDLPSNTVNATPFLTISDLSYVDESVRGLLGLAFHPDYETNGLFYVYMTDVNEDSLIRQYQVNPDGLTADPASATPILGIPQIDKYHYGGWIGFGPNDDLLYIASGDGGPGNDTDNDAQTITGTLRGKILRIDVNGDDFPADPIANYAVPATNPFVDVTGDDEIFAYGLRNPWRSSFDRATGDLYIGDVGQNAREEISVHPAGSPAGVNFGWRAREGTISNPGMTDPDPPGAIDPIYDYLQGFGPAEGYSVTGGYVYRGPIQALQGHYFFADFVSERIWSLRYNGDAPSAFDGTNYTDFTDWTDLIAPDVGTINLISSFGEDAAGNLYVVDYGGEVFRITQAALADVLTVQSVDDTGTIGSVTINPDGTVLYDPSDQFDHLIGGETATDSFTYLVDDGHGGTDTATVSVTISGVNHPPTAENDDAATSEDTAITINVLANDDSNDAGEGIAVQSVDDSTALGSVTLNPDGSISYDPSVAFNSLSVNESAVDFFTYTMEDDFGTTATATVFVTVTGVNDPPSAQDDSVSTSEDASTTIFVLNNDTDPDSTPSSMSVQRVADGLTKPVFATAAPGQPNLLYIIELDGQIKILDLITGTVNPTPFLNLEAEVTTGGERGLLGLAFHPNYASNRLFYISMTDLNSALVIRQYEANPGGLTADVGSASPIFLLAQPAINHNGGWMQFGPDNFLYVGTGDGGPGPNDVDNNAQDITDNLYGKILRIDVNGDDFAGDPLQNYAVPSTNPFAGAGVEGDDEIWVYGLRNPWRNSFDRVTGDLYIADVGQDAREEINLQVAGSGGGENYGWRPREGTIPTPGLNEPTPPGAIDPIYDYTHGTGDSEGNSITGGYVYRGPIPALQGNYFFGDFIRGRIWSLRFNGDSPSSFDGTNFTDFTDWTDAFIPDVGQINLIVSFAEDAAGNLYILDYLGEVFRVTPGAVPEELSILSVDATGIAGNVGINPDGTLSYDPAGQFETLAVGQSTEETFSYTISDGNGGTDSATVTVTIQGANDDPNAVDDSVTTDEDSPISVSVLLGDDDIDSATINLLSIDDSSTAGSISVGPSDTVLYDPVEHFDHLADGTSATDTFTYTIHDNQGGTGTATVTVTVNGINDSPDAVDDTVSTNEETSISVNVLSGDSDPDTSDTLTVDSVDVTATVGTVTLDAGLVTYDPAGQFEFLGVNSTATDTFSYTIKDLSGETSTANVSVTVTGVNDPPAAVDDTAETEERKSVTIDVLVGDSDPDTSDVLTVLSVDGTSTTGTVTLGAGGTVIYDPGSHFNALASGQTATDSFTYQISDGNGGLSSATVVVTIQGLDSPPVPIDGMIAHWSLDDGAGTVASDESGNDYNAAISGNPVWSSGKIDGGLDFDGTGDSLNAGQGPSIVGTGGFTVAAWVRSSSATNQVIVQQRSPQQYNGQYQLQLTASGRARFWTFGGGGYGPFVASSQIVNDGQWHHVVGVREDDGTSKVYIDGQLDGSETGAPRPLVPITVYLGADKRGSSSYLTGSLDDVRIYERALDAGEVDDLFLYLPTVDLGIAVNDSYDVDESSNLSVAAPGLLSNDNGAGLSVTAIDSSSALGASIIGGTDGAFQYLPGSPTDYLAQNESLTDTFSYTVSDGTTDDVGNVTIRILGVNDEPTAVDDNALTDEDSGLTIDVLANDDDIDTTDVLSVPAIDSSTTTGLVTLNANGTITYSPQGFFQSLQVNTSATASFGYTVDDGHGGSDTAIVSVTITGLNDLPVAVPDSVTTAEDSAITILVLDNDTDVDAGDVLSVSGVDTTGTLGNVTFSANDVFYDPGGAFDDLVQGEIGTDTFSYTVVDTQGGSVSGTVTITLTGVGLDLRGLDDTESTSESEAVVIDVLANDLDGGSPSGLTIAALDTSATLGTATINTIDNTVAYDPNGQFESLSVGHSATDTFQYTIDDGQGGSDTAVVTVTIIGVNDLPTANNDVATTNEDTAITINVLANDTDPDADDSLSVDSVNTSGTVGTISINPNGSIAYSPAGQFENLNAGQTATDVFSYTVTDSQGGFSTATVTVTIQGVDEIPIPTQGLRAHWSLNDGSGTTANDDSNNGYTATLGGDPVWSAGNVGGALDFDGSGDHLDAGTGPSIVGTGGFTVAAWIRTSSLTEQVIIQQRSPQQYNGEYQLHVLASGNVRFWTFGGFTYGPIVASTQKVNDGQWHHVVGVRENDGTTKIFIDGSLDGSKTGSPRPLVPITVYIGADMRGQSRYIQGSLDEVLIYDRPLSETEVISLASQSAASAGGAEAGEGGDSLVLINLPGGRFAAGGRPGQPYDLPDPPPPPDRITSFDSILDSKPKPIEATDSVFEDKDFVGSLSETLKLLGEE